MAYRSQIIPDTLSHLSPEELLKHHDNPDNFAIPRDIVERSIREINKLESGSFPKHATVLLTHGLFTVDHQDRMAVVDQIERIKIKAYDAVEEKEEITAILRDRRTTRKQAYRLLRNFSDWGTRRLSKYMFTLTGDEWYSKNNSTNDNDGYNYHQNVIVPGSPRIKGDPNRDSSAKDFKRETDFNNIKLIPRENQLGEYSGDRSYEIYHNKIDARLSHVEETYGGSITFDVHDTHPAKNGIFKKDDYIRPEGYPMMEIGSLDGASCNPEILEEFANNVEIYFGFRPIINEQDKGGYVTQKHGRDGRANLKNPKKRNMMQIELGRHLYMKGSTQEINAERMKEVSTALRMCIQKTCEKFGEEYFANLD